MGERSLAEVAEGLELGVGVVDASDERVLVGGTAARLGDVLAHDVVEVDEGVLAHARHEGVSRPLDSGVEGDGERKLLGLVGKAHDLRDDAAGGDREVTRAYARALGRVEPAQGSEGLVVVEEGLALPHEDHARDARVEVVAHVHDLLVDLCGGERAREAGRPRGAEGAAHGAARLRGGADRKAVPGRHAYALDAHAVGEAQQVLATSVRGHLARGLLDAPEGAAARELLAQGLGKVGHLVEGAGVSDPHPLLDLLGPEGGLSEAGEELLELPAREGVEVAPLGLVCRHGLSRVVRRHLEYPHLQGKLHVRV